ncbi:MAG: hypothetical protein PUC47_08120 [Oscillospiraceae bacterium]|nr:hypothetical protein [Oscillospiraceae bacterium]
MSILLSEFDPSPALIEPAAGRFLAKEIPCPKTAVSTFPLELFEEMIRLPGAVLIHELRNADRKLPVYAVPYKGTTLAVYPTPVGPLRPWGRWRKSTLWACSRCWFSAPAAYWTGKSRTAASSCP